MADGRYLIEAKGVLGLRSRKHMQGRNDSKGESAAVRGEGEGKRRSAKEEARRGVESVAVNACGK